MRLKNAAILTYFENWKDKGYLSSHGIEFSSNQPTNPYRLLKNTLVKLNFDAVTKEVEREDVLIQEILNSSIAFVMSPVNNCKDILKKVRDSQANMTDDSHKGPTCIILFSPA